MSVHGTGQNRSKTSSSNLSSASSQSSSSSSSKPGMGDEIKRMKRRRKGKSSSILQWTDVNVKTKPWVDLKTEIANVAEVHDVHVAYFWEGEYVARYGKPITKVADVSARGTAEDLHDFLLSLSGLRKIRRIQ